MAWKVGSAFEDLKKKIIIEFAGALAEALQEELCGPGWTIDNEFPKKPFGKYVGLRIYKENWPASQNGGVSIAMQSEAEGPRSFILGVTKIPASEPLDGGRLKVHLDQKIKPGKLSRSWEWWEEAAVEHRDWDTEEGAVRLFCRRAEALQYFKQYLLTLVTVAAPLIDEAVKSHRPS